MDPVYLLGYPATGAINRETIRPKNRVVRKLQCPSHRRFANHHIKTAKNVNFVKESTFFRRLVPD